MRHQYLFYLKPTEIQGRVVRFSRSESHHLSEVLRIAAGSVVQATDGLGNLYSVQLTVQAQNCWQASVLGVVRSELQPPLPIYLSLPYLKGDRWELPLEAACEIGVHTIFLTDYLQAANPWNKNRLERARRKAVIALKQTGATYLTEIAGPVTLRDLLPKFAEGQILLADQQGAALKISPEPALLLLGPEAGLHEEEESILSHYALQRFSLGPRRLRSEIAALVALAQLMLKFS